MKVITEIQHTKTLLPEKTSSTKETSGKSSTVVTLNPKLSTQQGSQEKRLEASGSGWGFDDSSNSKFNIPTTTRTEEKNSANKDYLITKERRQYYDYSIRRSRSANRE